MLCSSGGVASSVFLLCWLVVQLFGRGFIVCWSVRSISVVRALFGTSELVSRALSIVSKLAKWSAPFPLSCPCVSVEPVPQKLSRTG